LAQLLLFQKELFIFGVVGGGLGIHTWFLGVGWCLEVLDSLVNFLLA
jgi:hypothetical protein